MNERTIVKSLVAFLLIAGILATRNTDLYYIGAGVLFFVLCIAYAEWCQRL